MENMMNGQTIINGQGHLKGGYNHDERIMKNGSSGSNSSKYRLAWSLPGFWKVFLKFFHKTGLWNFKKDNLATFLIIKFSLELRLESTARKRLSKRK